MELVFAQLRPRAAFKAFKVCCSNHKLAEDSASSPCLSIQHSRQFGMHFRGARQPVQFLIERQVTLPTVVKAISRLGSAEEYLERTGSLHPIPIRREEGRSGSPAAKSVTSSDDTYLAFARDADLGWRRYYSWKQRNCWKSSSIQIHTGRQQPQEVYKEHAVLQFPLTS